MYVRGHVGLGQDSITDNLPDAYSDTTTLTGLPVIYELGIAGILGIIVWSFTRRAGSAVRKRAKKGVSKLARVL